MNHSLALLLLATAIPLSSTPTTPGRRLTRLTSTGRRPRPTLPINPLLAAAAGALVAAAVPWPAGVPAGLTAAAATWWFLRKERPPPRADPMTVAAAWDLLAACLKAGLPVPTAVTAVAGHLPPTASTALTASADLLALGADADTAWAPATACADTAALARGARRASHSGTALAELVTDLATTIRADAADTAEAAAQRAGVLLTAPLGLCFLPAFICLGVLPVIAGLLDQVTP